MQTKTQKKRFNNSNKMFLLFWIGVFMISLAVILILFFSIVKINYEMEKKYNDSYFLNTKSVEISTNKNVYIAGEKISLIIKNNKERAVYFEPCEYLNNFEKKINGEWKEESVVISNNNYYNQFSFNRNKDLTKCKIELPKSGEGIYRSVVRIYYNCVKPGHCESSEIFYSNEFGVK